MKLLGSIGNKITKDKNGENVPHLEITEVVLVHCNIVSNDSWQDSRVLHTFLPNKPFGSLLEISPTNHIFLKTFNSEFPVKNGTEIDNAQDIDIVMPMYNLIQYSNNYSKTSGSLWQYYKDDPNDIITQSESFKSKIKITGKTPANVKTKDVK